MQTGDALKHFSKFPFTVQIFSKPGCNFCLPDDIPLVDIEHEKAQVTWESHKCWRLTPAVHINVCRIFKVDGVFWILTTVNFGKLLPSLDLLILVPNLVLKKNKKVLVKCIHLLHNRAPSPRHHNTPIQMNFCGTFFCLLVIFVIRDQKLYAVVILGESSGDGAINVPSQSPIGHSFSTGKLVDQSEQICQ